MKHLALVLAAAVTLAACDPINAPEATVPAGNGYKVARLFTHEGCTVYRFTDHNTRYFVRCDSGDASAQWSESCGKNCTAHPSIPTARP